MPALKEHAGFIGLVAGAMIGAAAVLVTLGSVEVSDTKHAAVSNGWVRSGLVILLVGLVVLIFAAVVYVVGARKSQPAPIQPVPTAEPTSTFLGTNVKHLAAEVRSTADHVFKGGEFGRITGPIKHTPGVPSTDEPERQETASSPESTPFGDDDSSS